MADPKDPSGSEEQKNETDSDNNCTNLGKKLEALKILMEKAAAELEYKKQEQTNSANDFKELEKAISEITKIVEAYKKVRETLKQNIKNQDDYYCNKKVMIEARVGDSKDEIEKVINDFYTTKTALGTAVVEKEALVNTAEQNLKTSEVKQNEKAKTFEDLKSTQKKSEDGIKALIELQSQIEKKETESKFAVMFYYIKKFAETKLAIPSVIDKDIDFENDLKKAWCEMYDAKGDVREKTVALAEAKRHLEDAKKAKITKPQELETELIKQLENFKLKDACK